MKLSKNFSKSEFDSRDGAEMPVKVLTNIIELVVELQKLRDIIGVPITVNSGYRSPEHNKSIGGARNSQHVLGCACDIVAKDISPNDLANIIEDLIDNGILKIGGLGRYNTFTHIDIRNHKARWDNRS